jgi:L-iditol 2-dehydrogenase
MRIAICPGPGRIEVQRRPIPVPADGQVLVKVALCGICGTDVDSWRGSGHRAYPVSPGHEFCGTIQRTGARVTGLAVGQRVVVDPNLGCGACDYCQRGLPNLCERLKTRNVKSNGGLSEYVALDRRMAYALPDSLPDAVAAFIEPLSCALHAVRTAGAAPAERVAIFGAGTMGLLTGMILIATGCDLAVVEPAPGRREQAARLLGARVLTPEDLSRRGPAYEFEAAIDCSGHVEAVSQAIEVLRARGRLVLFGLVVQPGGGVPLLDVTRKELEIRGSWLNPHTFQDAINLANDQQGVLGGLTTEVFALGDVAAAFERAASLAVNRVLVRP